VSARRPAPSVLVVIRCGWGSCRQRLALVYPIRPRIEGDPAGMVVTVIKGGSREHIEAIVPADYSGNVEIATCPHDHNAKQRRMQIKEPGPSGDEVWSWSPTTALACVELKTPIERARITGRIQELRVK
jgi:hypothetical protein